MTSSAGSEDGPVAPSEAFFETAMHNGTLKVMFGDPPVTRAFKRGDFTSPDLHIELTDVPEAHKLFKPVVRDLAFDVCELSVMTYLIAKSRGVPLILLPAVLLARFQHPYIVFNDRNGCLNPKDLEGRKVGIQSTTVTTVTWVRGMLINDFGIDLERIKWVTFEDAHVAGVHDPPGVERAPPGTDLGEMLIAGELDAAAREWHEKYNAIQLNHMVVETNQVLEAQPDAVRQIYKQLSDS